MTHTPGPWFTDCYPNDDEDGPAAPGDMYCSGEFFRLVPDDEGERVTWVNLHNPDNARLIAAAPELLEALKEAYRLADAHGWAPAQRIAWDAAIAKAEGRS